MLTRSLRSVANHKRVKFDYCEQRRDYCEVLQIWDFTCRSRGSGRYFVSLFRMIFVNDFAIVLSFSQIKNHEIIFESVD